MCLMALTAFTPVQTPVGTWKTVDDDSGESKSYVKIYEKNGKLYGKISKILVGDADAVCEECSGSKHNKPILGLEIIEGMEADGTKWTGGEILDPENGKTYECELWVENGTLKVKGIHWTGLSRTQTWYEVK